MAGSRKNMMYKDDSGVDYIVMIDESNGETLGFLPLATGNSFSKDIEMRYVQGFFVDAPDIKRKLPVGTHTKWLSLITAPTIDLQRYPGMEAESFRVTYLGGEKRRIRFGTDTGINDGDNP